MWENIWWNISLLTAFRALLISYEAGVVGDSTILKSLQGSYTERRDDKYTVQNKTAFESTMGDKSVETLGSKNSISSVLDAFSPSFPPKQC